MPEKIIIAELDINMSDALKSTKDMKENVAALKKNVDDLKKAGKENSAEFIQANVAYKAASAELRSQEQILIKVTAANKAQAGSIDQLRAQLSIVSKQWSALSEEQRLNTEEGKALAAQKLQLTEALKSEETTTGDATRNVGYYKDTTISARQEIKQLTAALIQAKLNGDENSASVIKMKNRLGELKDTMADVAAEAKIMGSDTKNLDIMVGSFKAIGSAAQVAEGASALLGQENEEMTKSIQKMVAIQSVLNGVQEIGTALQKESAFMIGIKTVAVKVATAAQWLWNGAMAAAAAPLTIIIGSVAALTGGIIYLANRMNAGASETDKLKGKIKELEYQLKSASSFDEYYLKVLQAKGATDLDVTDQQIRNAKNRIETLVKEADAYQKIIDTGKFVNDEIEKRDKAYEDLNKTQDELNLLQIQRDNELKKREEEKAQEQEDAEKAHNELVIKNMNIRYEMNKAKQGEALKQTQLNYDALIKEENRLYSEGVAIAKRELNTGVITRQEYNQKIQTLEIEKNDNIIELNQKRADKALAEMNSEIEILKIKNQAFLDENKIYNEKTLQQEKDRLSAIQNEQLSALEFQKQNKLLSDSDYNVQKLQLEADYNKQLADLDEAELTRKIQVAQTDHENTLALAQGSIFAVTELERQGNELKMQEEIRTAEKTGASVDLIRKKYAKANLVLTRAENAAKYQLAAGFAANIATLAGEQTKIGKAAAVAATTINTYQSAVAAYTGMVETVEGPVGIALGIAAAAASVTLGLLSVKKILAVQPGSTPSGDLGSAGTAGATSSASSPVSSLSSVNTDIGQGIVARQTEAGNQQQAKPMVAVVVDDVTTKQNSDLAKSKASSL